MRHIAAALMIVGSLAFSACVPSIHPLFTAGDVTVDDSLVGAWVDTAADETWIFSKAGNGEYKLIQIAADGRTGEFRATLVRVGSEMFVDMVPAPQGGLLESNFLATHTFVHLARKADKVYVSVLEPKWIKEVLVERPELLRHERVNGDIILTASPKDIQAFLLANLKTRGALTEPTELVRKMRAAGPPQRAK